MGPALAPQDVSPANALRLSARGRPKLNRRTPRTSAKSQTRPRPPADFLLPLAFLLARFRAFLGEERSINAKSPCQKLFPRKFSNNQQNFRRFSSTFFGLSRFQVFLCAGSSKTQQKTFYKKNVSKGFYKQIDNKISNRFFSIFVYHVFGRFSVRGIRKHEKQISKKSLINPGTFLASEEPTKHVGSVTLFFECPLVSRQGEFKITKNIAKKVDEETQIASKVEKKITKK
jgi:hypothetical protein